MVTVDLTVRLQLPKEVAQQARESGLLTGEKIGELITAELERRRREAAARVGNMMDTVSAHMRAKYGDLSDEEAQAMIDAWIDEADEDGTLQG